jgi:hypothetical protein
MLPVDWEIGLVLSSLACLLLAAIARLVPVTEFMAMIRLRGTS